MTTPVRYAILTAVSSKAQAAEGKDSLPAQEENCRRECAGPFINMWLAEHMQAKSL